MLLVAFWSLIFRLLGRFLRLIAQLVWKRHNELASHLIRSPVLSCRRLLDVRRELSHVCWKQARFLAILCLGTGCRGTWSLWHGLVVLMFLSFLCGHMPADETKTGSKLASAMLNRTSMVFFLLWFGYVLLLVMHTGGFHEICVWLLHSKAELDIETHC